ncbi:hypothetical protein RKE38_11950 [Phycicoccus sp. M110.8]|uniref:hypothetical protein n=1 Tax=Phycicoccus sp. M110.8 TaxID=3075433 RepID=UPI0028FD2B56|nr:hypothetical protein [Phycicoccus sp. M110.8]MDU0314403.1 hypothetical protein [Phycicoccus sp. M110.8]
MKSVHLDFPRPQYVSVPEGFITALAARAYDVDYGVVHEAKQVLAVAYQSNSAESKRVTPALVFHQTRPQGEGLARFGEELASAGFESDVDQIILSRAVAGAIAGVRAKDGKVRAAIPMTPSLALAQNPRGLAGTRNPPDLGGILERFFLVGSTFSSGGQLTAADHWVRAAEHRRAVDRVIRAVDTAASSTFFRAGPNRKLGEWAMGVNDHIAGTPFSWFHRVWIKLCSPAWVEALPARVWVDWANTVLRLAFGLGYLWEVAWYERVSRSVIGGGTEGPGELLKSIGPLLPWKEQTSGISVRDVASSTKWRVLRSNNVRDRIREWAEAEGPFADAGEELAAMRLDEHFRAELTDALSAPSGSNENLWEAINYALLTREGTGPDADHYGFLRKNGRRFSVPDPGVEWIAAVASLSCSGPGTSTDVGQLVKDLRELGLRPELGDLVMRLEQAGVARGSADADQAVAIEAAF